MTTDKFTPGPWARKEFTAGDGEYCMGVISQATGGAVSWPTGAAEGTDSANAQLIAAAPCLLQELRNIANADTAEWDDKTEFEAWAKNRARAAVAKAVGGAA